MGPEFRSCWLLLNVGADLAGRSEEEWPEETETQPRNRGRREGTRMLRKYGLVLSVLLMIVGVLMAQEAQKPEEKPAPAAQATPKGPHTYNLTAEDIARKNPVAFTENSVARAKKLYQSQCAMCHGEKADGKGEVAEEMKVNPPDFTKPETLKDRTDGALFVILAVGSDTMPGQGTRDRKSTRLN